MMKAWRQILAGVLEWRAVDKGMIPLLMAIATYVQYLLWCRYTLQRPDHARLINMAVIHTAITQAGWMLLGAVLLLVLGLCLRRLRPDFMPFQHLAVQYLSLTLVALGYFTGTLSFVAGVCVLGAPVSGFIVLDRRVIWGSTVVAALAMAGLIVANALAILPYAPLLAPVTDAASRMFWLYSYVFFASPFLLGITLAVDHALASWRQREDVIRQLSRTDVLTGVHNRRSIMELLDREVARTIRHGPPLAVVLLDLDFFKRINDTWGHPVGDRVLQETVRVLRATIRQSDALGRYGGEEFLLLLPDTHLDGAVRLVERCRANLAETPILTGNGDAVRISASFGLASNEQCIGLSAETLIKSADDALYRAKEGGRNRVEAVAVLASVEG